MNQLGYYGKTLHKGDFVRFNLPQSFVKVWDDWLQQVMIAGETQNQTWPSQYAQAPTYRFVLSGGIAGNTPWIGILKPSQDKVGRRFPFCLAMSLPENDLPCISVNTKSLWFDEAEVLLARVSASDYHFEDLQAELASMADRHTSTIIPTTHPITLSSNQSDDDITISTSSSNALCSSHALPGLLDAVLQQTMGEYSLWMSSAGVETTNINSGLPTNNSGLALFTCDWKTASTVRLDLSTLASSLTSLDALPLNPAIESTTSTIDSHTYEESFDSTLESPDDLSEDYTNVTSDDLSSDLSNDSTQDLSADSLTDSTTDATPDSTHDSQTTQIGQQESKVTAETPIQTDIVRTPTTHDWAALDDFVDTTPVVVPDVEPLELEEDDAPTAPWER